MLALRVFFIILSPFHQKVNKMMKGRKDTFHFLKKKLTQQPLIWFHCASLGEYEQGKPLIEAVKKKFPSYQILLSFFSPSGYDNFKDHAIVDCVCYLPLDSASNARRFLKLTRPQYIFFIKSEYWYYYLYQAQQYHTPIYLISAIFHSHQIFFQIYGALYRKMLCYFQHIFVQNEQSKALLQNIGIMQVTYIGDTKFDNVYLLKKRLKTIPLIERFKNNRPILVIGSSWPEDIALLRPYLNCPSRQFKCIIAPHTIQEFFLQNLISMLNNSAIRFSNATMDSILHYDFLIIDSIGLLASIYQYGDCAYIGGGLKQGLHNILEPAVFGMPIFFGDKKYKKSQEAIDLIQLGGAYVVANSQQIQLQLKVFYEHISKRKNIGQKVAKYVVEHTGVTQKIMHMINWKM